MYSMSISYYEQFDKFVLNKLRASKLYGNSKLLIIAYRRPDRLPNNSTG